MATETFVSALDFIDEAKHPAIIGRTSTDDVTAELQTWLDFCKTNKRKGVWPAGVYNISSTLWITKSPFETNHIEGDGKGWDNALSRTTVISSNLVDPAFAIQYGRSVFMSDIHLIGPNDAPLALGQNSTDDQADYLSPGVRASRYSPNCGVCIDPTIGPVPPDGGYPGLTGEYQGQGGGGTAEVQLESMQIERFAVGLMCSPDGASSQGDTIIFSNGTIRYTDFAVSYGQSQSRACVISDSTLASCRTTISGIEHGKQSGAMPRVSNVQFGPCFRIISAGDTLDVMAITDCYAEAIKTIGTWGQSGARTPAPLTIQGCHLSIYNGSGLGGTREAPLLLECQGAYSMIGCLIRESTVENKAFNIVGVLGGRIASTTFTGGWSDNDAASVGHTTDAFARPFMGTSVITSSLDTTPLVVTREVAQSTQAMTGVGAVNFSPGQVQFTTPDFGLVSIGQLVFWRMLTQDISLLQRTVPAAVINNIVSDLIVCDLLYEDDQYDQTNWYGTTLTALVGGV